MWGAFRDQVIGTAILLLLIMAITDVLNTPPRPNLGPFIIGLVVVAIGMAWGTNAGYAINPARDFGPRLASFITGYNGALARSVRESLLLGAHPGPAGRRPARRGSVQGLRRTFLPTAEPEPPGRVPALQEA